MTERATLERRMVVLEEIEAIRQVKYRYWRCLDLKQWDDLGKLFIAEATVSYGDGQYEFNGVEAIMRFLRQSLGDETGSVTVHHGHHPEIELTGETTARGTWALYNYMYNLKQKRSLRIGAYYHDEYVKVGPDWLFKHIGYKTIFHEEWSREDTPSLKLVP